MTIRLDLSGRQPESVALLRRVAIVELGRHYHLRSVVSGADEALKEAVEWRWNGVAAGHGAEPDIEVEAIQPVSELQLAPGGSHAEYDCLPGTGGGAGLCGV